MLYLSEFQTKLSNQYITPAFSLTLNNEKPPSHYLIAGRNSSGKSLLISSLAGNGKVESGIRESSSLVAEVSVSPCVRIVVASVFHSIRQGAEVRHE